MCKEANPITYVPLEKADWTKECGFNALVEPLIRHRTKKPTDVGAITRKINKGEYTSTLSLYDACHHIGNGATWTSALMKQRNEKGFVSANFVTLDFDEGQDGKPLSLQDTLAKALLHGMMPAFYYYTFSSTEDSPRFRMVWMLDQQITDLPPYKALIRYMVKLFGADGACKDATRIWFGGKDLRAADRLVYLAASRFVEEELTKTTIPFNNIKSLVDFSGELHESGDERQVIREPDFDLLADRCKLWHEVVEFRTPITYGHRYPIVQHLALSASSLEGGVLRLTRAIRENPSFNDAKHSTQYYLDAVRSLKTHAHEERCSSSTCPFHGECRHIGFISDMVRKTNTLRYEYEEPPHISLEEGQALLKDMLDGAITKAGSGMRVIKASTGIGKTELLINADKNRMRWLIAVPTHKLKAELRSRWKKSRCFVGFQEEPIYKPGEADKMKRLRKAGLPCYPETENPHANDHLYSNDYDVMITTQDFALANYREFSRYCDVLIFDEDPTDRFFSTETASYSDLVKYIALMEDEGIIEKSEAVAHWLNEVKTAPQNTALPSFPQIHVDVEVMIKKIAHDLPPFNVFALMDEGSGLVKGRENVAYTVRREIPDGKIIVLSATAEEEPYRLLYGDGLVSFETVPPIQQKGELHFDVKHTYSASNMEQRTIKRTIEGLRERNPTFLL